MELRTIYFTLLVSFGVFLSESCGERPWWPIQSPNKGRRKKAKGEMEKEIRSTSLTSDSDATG